jgi:hypothetical protein
MRDRGNKRHERDMEWYLANFILSLAGISYRLFRDECCRSRGYLRERIHRCIVNLIAYRFIYRRNAGSPGRRFWATVTASYRDPRLARCVFFDICDFSSAPKYATAMPKRSIPFLQHGYIVTGLTHPLGAHSLRDPTLNLRCPTTCALYVLRVRPSTRTPALVSAS